MARIFNTIRQRMLKVNLPERHAGRFFHSIPKSLFDQCRMIRDFTF